MTKLWNWKQSRIQICIKDFLKHLTSYIEHLNKKSVLKLNIFFLNGHFMSICYHPFSRHPFPKHFTLFLTFGHFIFEYSSLLVNLIRVICRAHEIVNASTNCELPPIHVSGVTVGKKPTCILGWACYQLSVNTSVDKLYINRTRYV